MMRVWGCKAHPVAVGVIRGRFASVRPVIRVVSSCRRGKGSFRVSVPRRPVLTRIRMSTFVEGLDLAEVPVGTPPEPPEIVVELLALLVGLISAPEFFREFAAPAQETDFVEGTGAGAGEVVDVLGRLLMRAGTKSLVSAYRSVVT